jgi:hypothetical protein
MERDGLLVLKMDAVSRAIRKAIMKIVKALIDKQMPKVNASMVLQREEKKMDGVMTWIVV